MSVSIIRINKMIELTIKPIAQAAYDVLAEVIVKTEPFKQQRPDGYEELM